MALSWYKDEGFYYSSYDKPKGSALSDKTDQHKVYYHQLGTPQKKDVLIYGGTAEEKHRYIGATVTEDNRYLFVSLRVSTSGNKLIFKDLTKPNSSFIPILEHTESDTNLIYLNMVGGQDDVVFDGGSFLLNKNNNICSSIRSLQMPDKAS